MGIWQGIYVNTEIEHPLEDYLSQLLENKLLSKLIS